MLVTLNVNHVSNGGVALKTNVESATTVIVVNAHDVSMTKTF